MTSIRLTKPRLTAKRCGFGTRYPSPVTVVLIVPIVARDSEAPLQSTSSAGSSRRSKISTVCCPVPFGSVFVDLSIDLERLGNPGWKWNNYQKHVQNTEG